MKFRLLLSKKYNAVLHERQRQSSKFFQSDENTNVKVKNNFIINLPYPICWSSQHNFRMHFWSRAFLNRILVNLIVTNRSSLVLKFENVANTDFSTTPFFGDRDRGNFGYIPFSSVYNHVWCLNRGSLTQLNRFPRSVLHKSTYLP